MGDGLGKQGIASPQAENGHIDIANEIAEALMLTNLSAYQSRILWAIWRKTYGWHKKVDWIANSVFVDMTGLRKQHVNRTLNELEQRNIVTRSGYKVGFNKNYRAWRELPRKVTVTSIGNSVTNSGNSVTCTGVHKRNLIKETIKKKDKYSIPFETFWKEYPIKSSKGEAYKKFQKCGVDLMTLIVAIRNQKLWHKLKPERAFYPEWKNPATWLNKSCWEDEPPEWIKPTIDPSPESDNPKVDYGAKYLKALPAENKRFLKVVIDPLREEMNEHSWDAFIKPLVVKSFKDKKMVLFHKQASWIKDHFLDDIKELLPGIDVTITSE
ncbi:hypothetical protein LCGC14_1909130 [marine sediment metagenome]|uniref:Bacteriophage lambda Replication protein O N-terminal domain-containing protein n=1 Tax=marine sediment metagenome TaxID=412755 RepID=A0A0F9FU76_9ZZZZ